MAKAKTNPDGQPGKGKAETKQAEAKAPRAPEPRSRLDTRYRAEIVPALMREFGFASLMQVPRLTKIVVNIGVGEALDNAKSLEFAVADMTTITGQKPVVTKARKDISNFKLRAGRQIGVKVTLRGQRMYHFLDRLINVALPRRRDFRGVPPDAFDGRGNYTLGLREQIMFPEIQYEKVDKLRGMEITFVTTAQSDEQGRRLLQLLGMPFGEA